MRLVSFQVMETKNMLYIVSEYANQGEIFGKMCLLLYIVFCDIWLLLLVGCIFVIIQKWATCLMYDNSYVAWGAGGICRRNWLNLFLIYFVYTWFSNNLSVFSTDYIARYGKMNERTARQKFWQILSAVEYCHNRNIVHRDLKVR